MTEEKLKELAKAAGYEIKHGFLHSEEGSRIPDQSGYEIVNAYTGEAVTHSACGETWHFAYTLEEVEDFLKNVYEQSGVEWEPGIDAEEEVLKELTKQIDEDKRISLEACNILDKCVPMDTDVNLENCRELFNRVEKALKAEWDNVISDTYELRLKLFLILQILKTSNMNTDADEAEADYTDRLNELAFQIVKYKIRFGELEQEDTE